MRYRLDEKRLPQTLFPSLPESLESEFASLSAKIDEVLEQFDMRIVAAEKALTVVHAMRDVEKIAIREQGSLVGDIKAAGISIDDGAYFKGSIDIVRPEPKVSTRPVKNEAKVEAAVG